jgi:hypothetical protein
MDFSIDEGERPVDPERWEEILPLVVGSENITVAVPRIDDLDYAPWGIVDDSPAIEIRFSGLTDSGTRFTDGVLLRIGDKTPDGTGYYARSESNFARQPVIVLDAEWTEVFLTMRDNMPYADEPEDSSSG